MTVKLRKGIYWSDGVEFTAADVVHTVETQIKNPRHALERGARRSTSTSVETPDPYTVVFKLKKPNSRFHALFTVRWNAVWIMPKHVFEKVDDPLQVRFQQAGLARRLRAATATTRTASGTSGSCATTGSARRSAASASPGPKYLAYVDPGPPDKRVIAQLNHELDVIHDVAPEGMFTLAKQSKASRAWFKSFPYAHPDPTLPALIFNTQNETVQEPRRALGAGAADRHQGGVDGLLSRRGDDLGDRRAADRHASRRPITSRCEDWLKNFELDTGKRKIKPYDPTVGKQIADDAAALDGRADPDRSEGDRQVLRHGLVEARPAGGARSCSRRPASRSAATPG